MAPLTVLIGRSPSSSIFSGELLSCTVYSKTADLFRADRRDQVLRRQRVGDVLPGQSARLQRRRIEVDLDLPLFAAIGIGDRGAGHGDQRRAQLVDADIGEVLFGEAFARQRELNDRHRRGVVVQDQRRRRARRHLLEQRLRDRGDLGVGGADIDIGLEEDLDDAEAVIGVRDDVLDVVDRGGQRALERRGDAAGHLVGRQAGVLPDHADHGDADIRKDIGRRAQRGERPDDQDEQRQHNEGVRPAQRNADDGIHAMRFSIDRERQGFTKATVRGRLQKSRRQLLASRAKVFQSLSSHRIREEYYVSVIWSASKRHLSTAKLSMTAIPYPVIALEIAGRRVVRTIASRAIDRAEIAIRLTA